MGLTTWQKLKYIELPLALPTIFAGIKTAAVINIGTATLAAFIGAGGLGEFIVTGLALNNTELILRGAIPAALLAILTEFVFELIERMYVPKHLQQKLEK
jgi:osmoprotectant transport system permease protein